MTWRARGWRTGAHEAAFGAVMFLTLVPATAFANALRLAGVQAGGLASTIGSLAFAAASHWNAGWILTRERRASYALAVATVVLTTGARGPIPVVNSARAALLCGVASQFACRPAPPRRSRDRSCGTT